MTQLPLVDSLGRPAAIIRNPVSGSGNGLPVAHPRCVVQFGIAGFRTYQASVLDRARLLPRRAVGKVGSTEGSRRQKLHAYCEPGAGLQGQYNNVDWFQLGANRRLGPPSRRRGILIAAADLWFERPAPPVQMPMLRGPHQDGT